MAPKRINPYANLCKVTLEMPWETAEVLVQYLLPALQEIAEVTIERVDEEERKAKSEAEVKESADKRIQKSIARGRYLSRAIRHEQKRNGLDRREAINEISLNTGDEPSTIDLLIRFYLKRTKARWKKRKYDLIFRMFKRGHTNAEIGEFVGYSPSVNSANSRGN